MLLNRTLYGIAIITLFRFIWEGGSIYYQDEMDINRLLLLVILRSLLIFAIIVVPMRKFFAVQHRKFLGYMFIVALCAAYQLKVAHDETNQWTHAGIALEALFQEFSPEQEKDTAPEKKYTTHDYGEFAQLLVGVHKLRKELCAVNQEFNPCFERLLRWCGPEEERLVSSEYRAECEQAYHELIDDMNSYQLRIGMVYNQLEDEFYNMTFRQASTQELAKSLFEAQRENSLQIAKEERRLAQAMCTTWLDALKLLHDEDGRFWWDEELIFLGYLQGHQFNELRYKIWSLYQSLLKVGNQETPESRHTWSN